jgi:hypothetical protein
MVQGFCGGVRGVLPHCYCALVAASRRWCTTSIPRSTGVRDLTLPSRTGSGDSFAHAGSHMSCRDGADPSQFRSAPGEAAVAFGVFDEIALIVIFLSLPRTLPPLSFSAKRWLAVTPLSFSLLCTLGNICILSKPLQLSLCGCPQLLLLSGGTGGGRLFRSGGASRGGSQ